MSNENQSGRDNQSLNKSFLASFRSPVLELIGNFSETAIDMFILENSVLKDLPIVNFIVSGAKVAGNMKDFLLMRKILIFLNGCSSIPQQELEKFIDEIKSDPKERQKVGENLFLLLDKFEQFDKCDALAQVFGAYVRGKITREEFDHYSYALNNINIKNIKVLRSFYYEDKRLIDPDLLMGFANVGLVRYDQSSFYNPSLTKSQSFKENKWGKKFLEIISETSD